MSANNVESIPIGRLDSPQKLGDGGQLSTVIELSQSRHGIEKDLQGFAMAKGMSESIHAHPADDSRQGSQSSSVGPISNEKLRERSPKTIQYRASITKPQGRRPSTRDEPLPIHNGHVRASMADLSKPPSSKKRKKSGLGTVIRRIFGKRSVKNRISLPAPTESHYNDPNNFITAPVSEKQRAASAPTAGILRSSALGSHAPFDVDVPKDHRSTVSDLPPQPERPPPERPTRPRRASVPSVILSSQEAEDINHALTGLGFQDTESQIVDGHNIGFAVTSGSNPKRRSRSVGGHRSSAKEHRMSPIQWRQWRRRSDEIRYWRESTASDGSPVIGGTGFVNPEPLLEVSAEPNTKSSFEATDQQDRPFEEHNQAFNFGLPADDIQSNDIIGEHIGLEERMITLELKLMDFEFAFSKLQAGSMSPTDRFQPPEIVPANSGHSRSVSDQPRMHSSKAAGNAFIDQYPSLAYYQNGGTPASHQGPFNPGLDPTDIQPNPRPVSIATTLKASSAQPQNPSVITRDRSTRGSMTELTIEHYTTLITLIRREQSARIRLEDQVTDLQQQIQALQAAKRSPLSPDSQQQRRREQQQNLGRHFSPDDVRRPYRLGGESRPQRGRSSNYSEETDTDDDAFHEVYVTPVERGEFERGSFEGEEGVAF
ncbi:MAG: hypothetical protein Q9195_006543 [Heterodermia aff. obscurata]